VLPQTGQEKDEGIGSGPETAVNETQCPFGVWLGFLTTPRRINVHSYRCFGFK
jgi:hypothetical protein